ncbi:hypothetical protein P280DRAFT_484458 [Massarina eburnea CBS 473.64]|uniref:Uncharacterized protein n=1 Tax=Massarina eburnea CBS 473.64 TaxID=1395130 RepID=A0A6A6RKI0_9PLEO|nr:hypothetical protein P280DRAFT_484458 [Massarina eburnea CBS 473.64]
MSSHHPYYTGDSFPATLPYRAPKPSRLRNILKTRWVQITICVVFGLAFLTAAFLIGFRISRTRGHEMLSQPTQLPQLTLHSTATVTKTEELVVTQEVTHSRTIQVTVTPISW